MGPRLFSRGNQEQRDRIENTEFELQWGHDFSAVEITVSPCSHFASFELQWGHDFSAVEILASMSKEVKRIMLQWGHDFSAVEMMEYFRMVEGFEALQWGHDFSAVEMSRPGPKAFSRCCASMGPRLFSRGN